MYSIIYYSAGKGGGFSHHGFPPEGGDQNGLGLPAKHRGTEDVVGHVHLALIQWVESLICVPIFVYLYVLLVQGGRELWWVMYT